MSTSRTNYTLERRVNFAGSIDRRPSTGTLLNARSSSVVDGRFFVHPVSREALSSTWGTPNGIAGTGFFVLARNRSPLQVRSFAVPGKPLHPGSERFFVDSPLPPQRIRLDLVYRSARGDGLFVRPYPARWFSGGNRAGVSLGE
jgi:hypothetical protein